MMDFELQLEKPNTSRAWISALTMGLAYFIGMSFFLSYQIIFPNLSNRWYHPYDPIFRNEKRYPRSLYFDWYHGRHLGGLWLHQSQNH